MANCYYVDGLEDVEPGDLIELGEAEARHAARVSRARLGETILVGNGAGLLVEGEFSSVGEQVVVTARAVRHEPQPARRFGLAQALAKGDRDELAIQAATELGVDVIVPWSAERSVVRWREQRGEKALARWRSIVREAGKQSLRAWIPVVTDAVGTQELAGMAESWRLLVADPQAPASIADLADDGRDVLVIVGPEGGIAQEELRILGGEGVRLGDTVMRTSTAGPAALAALSVMFGRWRDA